MVTTTVYTPCCDIDITCCENRKCNDETVYSVCCGGFICIPLALYFIISGELPLKFLGIIIGTYGSLGIILNLCKNFMTCHYKNKNNHVSNAPPPHDLLRSPAPVDHNAHDIEGNSQSSHSQEVELSLVHNIDSHEKSLPLSSWRKEKLSHNEKVAEIYDSQEKTDEAEQMLKEYQRYEEERERNRLCRKKEIEKRRIVHCEGESDRRFLYQANRREVLLEQERQRQRYIRRGQERRMGNRN